MSKRRFLKTLSTMGLSGAALTHISKDALAKQTDRPEKNVLRLKYLEHTNHDEVMNGGKPETQPVYYTLPLEKHIRIRSTFEAAARLEKQFSSPNIRASIAKNKNSPTEREVVVDVIKSTNEEGKTSKSSKSKHQVRRELPKEATGRVRVNGEQHARHKIPVQVVERAETKSAGHFDSRYSPNVPGGCAIEAQRSGASNGTLGIPAYSTNTSGTVWTTAGHVVQSSGVKIYQPDIGTFGYQNEIGTADEVETNNGDAATIIPESDRDTIYKFAESDGSMTDYILYGTLGRDALEDMEEIDDLYVQGNVTGRHFEEVKKVSSDGNDIFIAADTKKGDSGGPYYWLNSDDEAYAAGIHTAVTTLGGDKVFDDSEGKTFPWVSDQFNLLL